MNSKLLHTILTYLIALVWLVNGLFCKVLNFVPRHQVIVGKILGNDYAAVITKMIGLAEIIMAIWVITKFKPKINAIIQMLIIATMNAIEFFIAPHLLLWGRLNALFAGCFIALIFFNQFVLVKSE